MPKVETDKKRKQAQHIDFFTKTHYTSNTATGIKHLYDTTKFKCIACKERDVDTKMAIYELMVPTFAIYRKMYCLQCWLDFVLQK